MTKNIAVLGAAGGIGKQAVLAALDAGLQVTAILRTPAKLDLIHPHLTIVQGDILQPVGLIQHLEGKDAVISAIGAAGLKTTTLYSDGSKNLIRAMQEAGVDRAFFISASGLEVNPTHPFLVRFATRFILQKILRKMYADLWAMEKIVKASPIHWTIMRPPRLTDAPATGVYRVAIDQPLHNGLKIARADVAHFMIRDLVNANPATSKKTVEIGY